ncbi:response regulator transcription factor [Clostridium sp. 19966]|uniref:response regulator transcription factor n=1 Tax=Clostridium sp. 19966 TaxID=2768166 RepID=UPI0028E01CC6|nr:response regulator transcription factor [Clostridium sp. 19966]MDT8717403.1 response regulator transcription factor [Clostridium sp. 19966]
MHEKILVVDDEENIVNVISYALKKEGYTVEGSYDGRDALNKMKEFVPDIIILDLMLPEVNGYDICKKIEDEGIGIIILTAKNDIVDKILGLELGADDYLTKPFDIREVIARVKSLCRRVKRLRKEMPSNDVIKINDMVVHAKQRSVTINDVRADFTAMEFDLLYLLISNPNIVYSREQLLDKVWGMDYIGGTRTVDTHIQRIRKKLSLDYQYIIQTVHGIGYKGVSDTIEGRD